ncbi:MAG: energy transducer TonB, partial [Flavobacteriales bacterium]|nr:energy transducer TonB [Flavobacteriales bacterium]
DQTKHECFQKSLMNHVIENFKYPEEAQKHGIQGKVIVKFVIQKDGSIDDISVLRGVSEELDNEAIRIVSIIPNINPALLGGKNVKVSTMIPISFKLN